VSDSFPNVDDHLVPGETRDEMLRGELIQSMPALPPHADRHCELDYLIRAHIKPKYISSSDMLTRVSEGSDFATDTSVRLAGINPDTNTRHLEELAFEVVSTQTMREMIMRAEDLTARGVRRLLAIFVRRNQVCEWSPSKHEFVPFSSDDYLDDPTLARPIQISALLDSALADNAVVDALDAKGVPRMQEIRQHEREQGLILAIETLCQTLGVDLTPERRGELEPLDAAALRQLLAHIGSARDWPA
jgi:hypothetical protein